MLMSDTEEARNVVTRRSYPGYLEKLSCPNRIRGNGRLLQIKNAITASLIDTEPPFTEYSVKVTTQLLVPLWRH